MLTIKTLQGTHRMSTQDLLLAIEEAVGNGETSFEIEASGQHDIGGPLWNREGKALRFHVTNPGQRVGSMCLDNTEILVDGPAPADVGWLNAGGRIVVRGDAGDTAGHCAAAGVIMLLICNLLARPMLALLNTKDELIDGATLYLKIYAFGMPAMALYNFGNGVLSATGDTKRPLIYLSLAGVLNVALNLFFVIKCHMAADGVALASVIAQWLSALLIVLHLLGRRDECRLEWRKLRFHPQAGRRVLAIGIPTGLQNAIFAIANLFVQVGVNSFDAVMVSGNSAAANADTLIFNMMAAFYTACATFGSRNWGAGNNDRILKSYRISMCYAAIVGGVAGGLLLLFGREFLSIFANEPEVIDAGMQRLRIMGFSFVVAPWMDASIAASRSIGRSVVPTVIVILGSCVFRVIWVYTIFAFFHTIPSLYLLYIFSWAITGTAEYFYFRASYRKHVLRAA